MIENCKGNLNELKNLLSGLTEAQYTFKSELLAGATIGQHIRHILEFYLCLFEGESNGVVNYDNRKRELKLELDKKYAIYTIGKISSNFIRFNKSKTLILEGNFTSHGEEVILINTSLNRELAYCLEHSIHHQALIKIGLIEQGLSKLIDENFGVAPATIRHRKALCAQ